MRPIYLSDLDAAVRVLLAVPQDVRAAEAANIVKAADTADRNRKRFAKAHPVWGTGTLVSAVADRPHAKASYCNAAYRACLQDILAALAHQSA